MRLFVVITGVALTLSAVRAEGRSECDAALWSDAEATVPAFISEACLRRFGDWRDPNSLHLSGGMSARAAPQVPGATLEPIPPASWQWVSQTRFAAAFTPGRATDEAIEHLQLTGEMGQRLSETLERFRSAEDSGQTLAGRLPGRKCLMRWPEGELGKPMMGEPIDSFPGLVARKGTGFAAIVEVVALWPGWDAKFAVVSSLVQARVLETLWAHEGADVPTLVNFLATGGELVVGSLTICQDLNEHRLQPVPGSRLLLWADLESEGESFLRVNSFLPVSEDLVDQVTCAYCSERAKVPLSQIRNEFAAMLRDASASEE